MVTRRARSREGGLCESVGDWEMAVGMEAKKSARGVAVAPAIATFSGSRLRNENPWHFGSVELTAVTSIPPASRL